MLQRRAPAKLNLGLHVVRRRDDGYHDIETVFVRLPWADVLTLRDPDAPFRFTCSDDALPTDEHNLCVRAAQALADATGAVPRGHLHLDKHVPYGAGLGGGSSDAAATLRLLDEAWRTAASPETLHGLALHLGADVPFFLGPEAAYATGLGERLSPLYDADTGDAYRVPFPVCVVVPQVEVSTPEAYGHVTPDGGARPHLPDVVRSNDPARWRRELRNDFEAWVLEAFPPVAEAREALLRAGASYASLTGSGSAVFATFDRDGQAEAAAEALRTAGLRTWHGRL